MIKQYTTLFLFIFLGITLSTKGQDNVFLNSSFENTSNCVALLNPSHSQFGNVVDNWFNVFPNNVSTADQFGNGILCSYVGFSSLTNTVSSASNTASHGCSWAGLYLNYYDPSSFDDKFREYIGQGIDLQAGVSYTLTLDLAKSNHSSSSTLEVDFAIYGYNGPIPAGNLDYCILGADVLGSIDKTLINTSFQNFTVTFTPNQNYQNIILGGANCGVSATSTGYVFIDNVRLSSNNNSILNPVIESFGSNSFCGYNCIKESFQLLGNQPPSGVSVNWTQASSNPEQVTFLTPNQATTGIQGQGQHSFVAGEYTFYYTFSNGTTTATESVTVYIYELPYIAAFAVVDEANLNFCNGTDQSSVVERHHDVSASPSNSMIVNYNLTTWWSMIRYDGSEWVFPNGCTPGDGIDEGDVFVGMPIGGCGAHVVGFTNSNVVEFNFRKPQDTVQFIWHVQKTDECNNLILLEDTTTLIINDVDFAFSDSSNPIDECCVGGSMVVSQVSDPDFNVLNGNPNLTFNWTYMPNNGGLTFVDNTVANNLDIIGNIVGVYKVNLTVTDNTTNCSWSDEAFVKVSGCAISGGSGLVCNSAFGHNDLEPISYDPLMSSCHIARELKMDAGPSNLILNTEGMGSWWSMIRDNGTVWTFPNGCVPYDGMDEGNVFSETTVDPCGNVSSNSPSSSDAIFYFRNAVDTIEFVWNVTKLNQVTNVVDTIRDTVIVNIHDVDFSYSCSDPISGIIPWVSTCNDTVLLHQLIDSDIHVLADNPNLEFDWDVVVGDNGLWTEDLSTTAYFVNDQVSDSALFVSDMAQIYVIRLKVRDIITGCTWFDILYVERVFPVEISAGSDVFECVSQTGDFYITANASANFTQGTQVFDEYSSWWSVIQDNGNEFVFSNGCVPSDGHDDGNIFTYLPNSTHCGGLITANESYAAHCLFGMRLPAQNDFIWHVIDPCTGDVLTDTVSYGFQALDIADAGIDETVNCSVVSLEGNLSTLSSANSGSYFWRQIGGASSLNLLSPTTNIAYFPTTGVLPGVYDFEYALGFSPCTTYDTVSITVSNNPSPTNITMTVTEDTICPGEEITFTASGGVDYQFLIDGEIVRPFAPINTFSYDLFTSDHQVTVLATVAQSSCIEILNTPINIHVDSLPAPEFTTDSIVLCEGETADLQLTSFQNSTYNWSGPNGFSSLLQNPNIQNTSISDEGYYSVYLATILCQGATDSLFLQVGENYEIDQVLFLCPNDSVLINGIYQHTSGTFTDSLQSVESCDSIVVTTLVIGDTINLEAQMCNGDSLFLEGSFQHNSGSYLESYISAEGCDSIVRTELIVNPIHAINLDLVLCVSDSVLIDGIFRNSSGVYYDALTNVYGCDSIMIYNVTMVDTVFTNLSSGICQGDSLLIFGAYESLGGVYTLDTLNAVGCDSIVYYSLTVEDETITNNTLFICDNDSVFLEGEYQNTTGIYNDTLYSVSGCDSVLITTLNIRTSYSYIQDTIICEGDSLFLEGEYQSEAGIFSDIFNAENGCDSAIVTNLVLKPSPTILFNLDIEETDMYHGSVETQNLSIGAESYEWDFQDGITSQEFEPIHNYTDTGHFQVVLTGVGSNGCARDYTQLLIVKPVVSIYVPNSFSPNGDGVNDLFFFKGYGITEVNFEFTIFNRWGEMIYQTQKFEPWNGTEKGRKAELGNYIYMIKYLSVNGVSETVEGHVILLK